MHRKGEETMPSNNSKYTEEFREQIAIRVLQTDQSATSLAEETGLNIYTKAYHPAKFDSYQEGKQLHMKINGMHINIFTEKG